MKRNRSYIRHEDILLRPPSRSGDPLGFCNGLDWRALVDLRTPNNGKLRNWHFLLFFSKHFFFRTKKKLKKKTFFFFSFFKNFQDFWIYWPFIQIFGVFMDFLYFFVVDFFYFFRFFFGFWYFLIFLILHILLYIPTWVKIQIFSIATTALTFLGDQYWKSWFFRIAPKSGQYGNIAQ